jgi:hypothetical protein
MILAFKKTYQQTSSNGVDLAELEPKLVDHRQISIDLVWCTDRYLNIHITQVDFCTPAPEERTILDTKHATPGAPVERASTLQKRGNKAKEAVLEKCVLMKHNARKPR